MTKRLQVTVQKKFDKGLELISGNDKLIPSKTKAAELFLHLINTGHYDDVLRKSEIDKRVVNMPADEVKKAREHVKQLGITKLGDALNEIINYEYETGATDLDEMYVEIKTGRDEGDDEDE